MAKQTFVADTILTAAQMNALQGNDYNQTVSTKTASYTLVAADAGTKIVMNAGATNTTITVNTSLFAAGDTLTILNTSTSGTCTITAGTATVATAGSLALGLNQGGTLYFTSAGVSVFQANGVAAAASGLTFLSGGTVTATSTANFDSVFSATYDNYRVMIYNIVNSGSGVSALLKMRVGGVTNSAAAYTYQNMRVYAGPTASPASATNDTGGLQIFAAGTTAANNGGACILDFTQPFLAKPTTVLSTAHNYYDGTNSYFMNINGGTHAVSSSFDGFSIVLTTTTIAFNYKIYGYANS